MNSAEGTLVGLAVALGGGLLIGIERERRNEETQLPADLDYRALAGLSHEVRQRLSEARPATLGQAGRIPGVTAAAVSILLVHLKKRSRAGAPRVA